MISAVSARSEWRHVSYEICRVADPFNLEVQVVSAAPSDPGSVVLRGGTGQTLEGFEQLRGTITKVTALHRPFDAPSEGEIVLSDTSQDVTFLAATDDGTPRRFAAFDVPPGEVTQIRFHVEDVTLDLSGVSHDVGVGSGAQTGIKVIPEGGRLLIPEDESVSLAVDFDLTRSLSHNRGRGFMLDPVVLSAKALPTLDPVDPAPPPAPEPPSRPELPATPILRPALPGFVADRVLDVRSRRADGEETLLRFEEHFDVVLDRERAVTQTADAERLDFIPALLFPRFDPSRWEGEPAFLGVMRLLTVYGHPDHGRYIGVQYGPDGSGGQQWTFVDSAGETIVSVPADGVDIPLAPQIEYSELDPIAGSPWGPIDHTDPGDPVPDLPDDPPDQDRSEVAPFGPDRSRVIVLVHGAMNLRDRQDPENLQHVLRYWGFDFTAELLGVPGVDALRTFEETLADATVITRDEWGQGGFSNERLEQIEELERRVRTLGVQLVAARALRAYSLAKCLSPLPVLGRLAHCVAAGVAHLWIIEAVERREMLETELGALKEPDVRIMPFVYHGSSVVEDEVSGVAVPERVVMLTHRNGTLGLGEQAGDVTGRVSQLYDRLVTHVYPPAGSELFDRLQDVEPFHPPQIYFVGHSIGGLALRYLLSRPEEVVADHELTENERTHAAFLASRTVAVIALQSPHDGTPAADEGVALAEELPVRLDDFLLTVLRRELHPDLARAFLSRVDVQQIIGGDWVPHLTTPAFQAMNTGALAPHRCNRPGAGDDSDAGKTLIPIYTLAGRTPSAGFFNNPDLDWENAEGWRELLRVLDLPGLPANVSRRAMQFIERTESVREIRRMLTELGPAVTAETIGLMLLDGTFSSALHESWGDPIDGTPETLDLMRRVPLNIGPFGTFPNLYLFPFEDESLEQDNDGLLGAGTGLGVRLGTEITDFFSNEAIWEVDGEAMRGSWYRVYLTEQAFDFANHSSIRFDERAGAWIRETILDRAGPYVAPGDVSGWEPQ
jgi:hypothetical protein